MSLSKLALACSLALGAMTLCAAPAGATVKTAKPAKQQATNPAAADPDAAEPDTAGSTTTDFNCELGNQITIYSNEGDEAHIALRWKKRLHRLTRVGTTTGAQRFENRLFGLIWIGIPAKGMLLDSKQNRQLANECKNAEQAKPTVAEAPVIFK